MYNATEQFAEMNKTNVAQATKFAAVAARQHREAGQVPARHGQERLRAIGRECARRRVHQGRAGPAVAAHQVRRSAAAIGHGLLAHLYELATAAQAEYSALAEESFGFYSKGMAAWVDKASKSAPAGSDVAVNAFKSTIAATTAAFDQFQKATKQVANLADANMRAAAATATKAVKTGKKV